MKNIRLLGEYIETEGAHCPKCKKVLFLENGDKCSNCGKTIELTIVTKPRLFYSWKTGVWYKGIPVGWIFLAGFLLGISAPIITMKFMGIL